MGCAATAHGSLWSLTSFTALQKGGRYRINSGQTAPSGLTSSAAIDLKRTPGSAIVEAAFGSGHGWPKPPRPLPNLTQRKQAELSTFEQNQGSSWLSIRW